MAVGWTIGGRQLDTSLDVSAKLTGTPTSTRLACSLNSGLTSPIFSSAATVDGNLYAKMRTTGLTANTRYYYGVEIDGTIDPAWTGRIRTLPTIGAPASFRVAFTSCSQTLSSSPGWQRMADRDPLMIIHSGDWHYENVATNSQSLFRTAYESSMSTVARQNCLKNVGLVYMWDNHDYGNGGDCDSTSATRPAIANVYRQIIPSYDLPAGSGNNAIYHDYQIGRVPFIVTDQRWGRITASISLDATQLAWFKTRLLAYRDAGAPVIFWVSEQVWHSTYATSWGGSGYSTQRDAISAWIQANNIPPVVILSGDAHKLAYHPGYAYGTNGRAMSEHVASGLDQIVTPGVDEADPSHPFLTRHDATAAAQGLYSMLEVHDNGTDVSWSVAAWAAGSTISPDENAYVVDSRTPLDAPKMRLSYMRPDSPNRARLVKVWNGSAWVVRPVYAKA